MIGVLTLDQPHVEREPGLVGEAPATGWAASFPPEVVATYLDSEGTTVLVASAGTPVGTTRERIDADAARMVELAHGADVAVVGMQSAEHRAVVERLRATYPDLPIVVVSFGTPYLLSYLPRVEGYVCAFGWRDESERAAAAALIARQPAAGTMPVELTGGPRLGAR